MHTSPFLDASIDEASSTEQLGGWSIAGSYGDLDKELEALESGIAWTDTCHWGRLEATGTDHLDLINRLSTNEVESLTPGGGTWTVLTTSKGRIVDLIGVSTVADNESILFTSPGRTDEIVEAIDFYTFGEDIELTSVMELTALCSLVGPRVIEFAADTIDQRISSLTPVENLETIVENVEIRVFRVDRFGVPELSIMCASEQAGELRDVLLQLKHDGMRVVPVGADAVEEFRVQQGIPSGAHELTEDYNPHEARLRRYIDFHKGCYVGQEVVARLENYDKVKQYLMRLQLTGEADEGTTLMLDGKRAGTLTTVRSMRDGTIAGLGFVIERYATVGDTVSVGDNGTQATVLEPLATVGESSR